MTDDNNITNNDTATTSSANDYDENGFEWYNNLSQELSPTQQVIIVIGIILSSILSAIGSGIILSIIIRDRTNKLKRMYHRLLFGLSTVDLMNSIRGIVTPFLMPTNSFGVQYVAFGNTQTCEVIGFISQLGKCEASEMKFCALAVVGDPVYPEAGLSPVGSPSWVSSWRFDVSSRWRTCRSFGLCRLLDFVSRSSSWRFQVVHRFSPDFFCMFCF